MKIILHLLLILTMTLTTSCQSTAQSPALHTVIRQPTIASAHPPMLILLHGYGSNEQDLYSLAQYLPGQYLLLSARAPYSIGGDGYAWYSVDFSSGKPVYDFDQEKKSRETLIAYIAEMKKKYDAGDVYLGGFSQGAIMSYSIGLTRPDLVKGIAILSGRLLDEIKPVVAPQKQLQQLKIFIAHGTTDNMLQVQYAKDAVTYLKSLTLAPIYKEYNIGHTINEAVLQDLIQWLN
jgi:phospholipase/carboxylesterase